MRRTLIAAEAVPEVLPETEEELRAVAAGLHDLKKPAEAIKAFEVKTAPNGQIVYTARQKALHHRLSDVMEARQRPSAKDPHARTENERRVCLENIVGIDATCGGSAEQYLSLIKTIAQQLTGRKVELRRTQIRLRSTSRDAPILLPGPEHLSERVSRLAAIFTAVESGELGLLGAIWHYVLFLNCHPFDDANGRTARILLNVNLHSLGAPAAGYVPLAHAMNISRGGYELRLREAEIFGRWDPIMLYMGQVIRMSCHGGD